MQKLRDFLGLIRFEHTIFALPFAFVAAVAAQIWVNAPISARPLHLFAASMKADALLHARIAPPPALPGVFPSIYDLVFILIAMASGRTLAMLANRIIDARIDAVNPRTAARHIPAGRVSIAQAQAWAAVAAAVFFLSALALNLTCFFLALPAAFVLILYPLAKRYTPLAHYALGFAQAIAPVGVFIAITGTLSWQILPLAAAVGIWIGSFDIYYALQDVEVDRAQKLHSLPADLGVAPAMWIALAGHIVTGALLIWSARIFLMGNAVAAATLIFTALLAVEHVIVKMRPKLIGVAFFTLNGVLSVAYALVVLASRIASPF